MLMKDALWAIPRRLRSPLILSLTIGIFILQTGLLFATRFIPVNPSDGALPFQPAPLKAILLYGFGIIYLFGLTPFPWQWTRDDRPMASVLRGALQALIFGLLYALGTTLINWGDIQRTMAPLLIKLPGFSVPIFIVMTTLMSVIFNGVIGYALALWETRRQEKAEALRQTEEARWTLLKAQMSPHVLLNSLNGLAELVREDEAAAIKGMRDLAEIYRQLLSFGDAPKVPLEKERRLLESYLAVEKLRLGEQLHVEWDWDPQLDGIATIPLLVQPLVENAIKHGIAADPQGGTVRIQGRIEGARLLLTVANTGQSNSSRKRSTGVGLANLKSRLELAYGGKAQFHLVRESPWTRAELQIPWEA